MKSKDKMLNYLFLDNWVLSDYTTNDRLHLLSDFIRKNDYTIIIDSLSFTELYNPGWAKTSGNDRTVRATELLGQHHCVIVDPKKVWKAELQAFPDTLVQMPIELDLNDIPAHHRSSVLLMFLRRDRTFLEQGKDIAQWAAAYKAVKSAWTQDSQQIIDHACKINILARDNKGNYVDLQSGKEEFLRSLDARHLEHHFNAKERATLRITMNDIKNGATSKLPAIRSSSLYFWYTYIEIDKAYIMKKKGSDIGDYYQMSLLPYCSAFTVDTTMYRLAHRVLAEINCGCEVMNWENLDAKILKSS